MALLLASHSRIARLAEACPDRTRAIPARCGNLLQGFSQADRTVPDYSTDTPTTEFPDPRLHDLATRAPSPATSDSAFAAWQAGDGAPLPVPPVRRNRCIFAHSNTSGVANIWEPNWEPTTAGSRRRQATTSAHIRAVRWLIGLHQATHRDALTVPSKQRVAGSNPAGRTHTCSELGKLVSLRRRPSCFGQATRRYRRYFGAGYLCSAPPRLREFSMPRPVSSTVKTASKPALKNPLRASTMPHLAPRRFPRSRKAAAASLPDLHPRSRRNSSGGCRLTSSAPRCWTQTNKHHRPFQEETIRGYAETARALDLWMAEEDIDYDFTACSVHVLNRFFAAYRNSHGQGGTNTRQRNLHHLFTWLAFRYDHPDPWTGDIVRYGPVQSRPSTLAEGFIRDLLEVK